MLSIVEGGGKRVGEDSANKLLNEVETINKALYLDKTILKVAAFGPKTRSRSARNTQFYDPKSKTKYGSKDMYQNDKKCIWNWKPLKAFSNARNRKFNCCFSLRVHSIEGLPLHFENASFSVHWKRRDRELVTNPAKVLDGVAEFEEKLNYVCVVYGRSGPHHSAKYEAKHFLLFASVLGDEELDLGKHRLDLTKLLPLTLEELNEEKSLGKWITSFKLSGEAKGAMMNVSFGYKVVRDSALPLGNFQNEDDLVSVEQKNLRAVKPGSKFGQADGKSALCRTESLPGTFDRRHCASSRSMEDLKDLNEMLPVSRSELVSPVDMQHHSGDKLENLICDKPLSDVSSRHLDPVKSHDCLESKSNLNGAENESADGEFSVTEQGIKFTSDEQEKPDVVANFSGVCFGVHSSNLQMDDISKDSVMTELESAMNSVSNLKLEALDSPEKGGSYGGVQTNYGAISGEMAHNFDDDMDSVANDFLEMLEIESGQFGLSSESEPEFPRERLLRQFEKDVLADGFSLFDSDANNVDRGDFGYGGSSMPKWENLSKDFDLSSAIRDAEEEHQMGAQATHSRTRAKTLEDMESKALMHEWGLNDNAFQHSPPKVGFGTPINLPPEEPLELPPLGEGLGPFMQTKNGGFLQSMNPAIFRNAKSQGNLIMQVSSPVVLPAQVGSDVMDILQGLASVGIEKLSLQANKLMPLEGISRKTMQQVAWEAGVALEGFESRGLLRPEIEIGRDHSSRPISPKGRSSAPVPNKFRSESTGDQMELEYVSLEELAPLAMDKIEALSMEGLRIQSDMSDEDAPSNISARSTVELSALQGMEGTAGLQLLGIRDLRDDIDGLMGLSLTLDEWMRLDSGDDGNADQISEPTTEKLAAHHANFVDSICGGSKGEKRHGKGSGCRYGFLGNNFTVALMVQLRDSLRNYETIGMPMLALNKVERVFIPPKPKTYCKVSEVEINNKEDDESDLMVKDQVEEISVQKEGIPRFRIHEVNIAGIKNKPGKTKVWGTSSQQQLGSRWLVANGMGKSNKHPLLKSKTGSNKAAASSTSKAQSRVILWSISSCSGGKWKESAASKPHTQNPNLLVSNGTIKLL